MKKIPFWAKFGFIFTIVVSALVLLELFTASSLEFGTWGLMIVTYPAMFLLEAFNASELTRLSILLTFLFIFAAGSLIGLAIQRIRRMRKPATSSERL